MISVLLETAEDASATAHRERAYSEVSLSALGHPLDGFAELPTISEPAASDVAYWNAGADPSTQALVHHIILDCSTWAYIDLAGIRVLKQVLVHSFAEF